MTDAKPVDVGEPVEEAFDKWWDEEGQYLRAGGGDYEYTFARQAWKHQAAALLALQAEVARLTQENARLAGEVADLGDALVYVAHTLHTTPQHMLCKGVSLIDSNRVRVRIGNIDVTATEREEGKGSRRDE